jgi:sec-independent protein translocase protein TatA
MSTNSLLLSLGAPEIILIVLVVVLLFGGRKIPELMKGLGQGMREFKKASKGENETGSGDKSFENSGQK